MPTPTSPHGQTAHHCLLAGNLLDWSVIIAGAGPIGFLFAVAARHASAAEFEIFDIAGNPPTLAEDIGVDAVLRLGNGEALQRFETNEGYFGVAFEATGAVTTLAALPRITRPGGTIMQIGCSRETSIF